MNKFIAAINIGQQFFTGGTGNTSHPLAQNNLLGIASVISLVLKIAFIAAGFILFVFALVAGIGLMGSSGESNPQKAEQTKKTLTSALIGFVVVFASYWIVQLIGSLIGIQNII